MSSHVNYTTNIASTPLGQRKVAIPRLQRSGQGHNAMRDRRRVPRACTACRSHKIKCTGERPQCKHCATTSRDCVYIMPRKDRLKIITERCLQMAGLLQTLRISATAEDNARITDILDAVEEETSELRQSTTPSNPDTEAHGSQESMEFCSSGHPSELDTESLDLLDEDLHHESARATGFVGKNSEVQWLRAVALAQAERPEDDGNGMVPQRRGSHAPGVDQVSTFSYWTDSEHVDVDFYVDAYELPQAEVAERLLQCYMLKVHDSFPILPRKTFEDQFRVYFTALQNGKAPRLSSKWQAILNLVFAIGTRYSHLVKASWRADERDHLIYQARARSLGINDTTVTSHADVPQIQGLGLQAFYWLSTGQVSRAWTVIGIALRSAYALGLHVRNEDPTATAAKRETLVRTWWSLYSLERTLSIITGRPSIIVDSCCSVPLPIPVPEDRISDDVEAAYRMRKQSVAFNSASTTPTFSVPPTLTFDPPLTPVGLGPVEANSGSYFRAVIQLSIITQSILTSLYSAGTMIRSPGEIQQDVSQLGQRLEQWATALPMDFSWKGTCHGSNTAFVRERMLLGFQLCSAKMLLTRPYLTGRRQSWREANEASFARRMANNCIEAAKTCMNFLPNDPQPDLIYDQGPWWCIVHHIMQAVSVFLLGLSYPSATSQDSTMLIQCTKKAIRWLQVMQDPVAERAYHVALTSLTSVARRYAVDVSDLWSMAIDKAIPVGKQSHPSVPEVDMSTYIPAQFVSMAPPSSMGPTMASYAAYDAVAAGTAFPSSRGPPIFNGQYFMVR